MRYTLLLPCIFAAIGCQIVQCLNVSVPLASWASLCCTSTATSIGWPAQASQDAPDYSISIFTDLCRSKALLPLSLTRLFCLYGLHHYRRRCDRRQSRLRQRLRRDTVYGREPGTTRSIRRSGCIGAAWCGAHRVVAHRVVAQRVVALGVVAFRILVEGQIRAALSRRTKVHIQCRSRSVMNLALALCSDHGWEH